MCTVAPSVGAPSRTETYLAYGLGLRSVVPLPASVSHDGTADVELRLAALLEVTAELRADARTTRVGARETQLLLPGIGTFVVRDGCEVLVDRAPGADDVLLQLAIVGPVLATLLQQRGWLVLHASAVEMDGVAVGFLGTRGAGKSTTAAALHGRRHSLLADDILAVRLEDGLPRAVPGFPQLKLWPDAAQALGGDLAQLPPLHAAYPKRAHRIDGQQTGAALPLACLYVLCEGDRVEIEPLTPPEAFLQLVAHSYGIGWLHAVSGATQFRDRADLARRIPLRRLRRPRDLTRIPELAGIVEADHEGA